MIQTVLGASTWTETEVLEVDFPEENLDGVIGAKWVGGNEGNLKIKKEIPMYYGG